MDFVIYCRKNLRNYYEKTFIRICGTIKHDVMRAQEDFCKNTEGAYIITRVCSFIPWDFQQGSEWFDGELDEEFSLCRDKFLGFDNHHINEKGFKLVAKYAVPNIIRILIENRNPQLEEERVKLLK